MVQEKDIRCVQNPAAGRERRVNEFALPTTAHRKKIVVVGAGPAGMKYAEIAVRRGHHVTVLERERALGGQVLLAANQPAHANVAEVASYLEAVLADLNVEVRRNTNADADYLVGMDADAIIVATGSTPNLPGAREPWAV